MDKSEDPDFAVEVIALFKAAVAKKRTTWAGKSSDTETAGVLSGVRPWTRREKRSPPDTLSAQSR